MPALTLRKDIVDSAYEDWLLNMNVGMSPKVARELVEYDYPYFSETEQTMIASLMLSELERRMEK